MKAKYYIKAMFFYLFRMFPISENKILIKNWGGKGFGDNGKYIALELLKQSNKQYDIVWLLDNIKEHEEIPNEIRKIEYSSIRAIYEQVTAKVWISNTRQDEYVRKRNKQYYIMTWHGGIYSKKIEKAVEKQLPKSYVRAAKHDSSMADLFLAESDFTYQQYRNVFWYDGEILKCGSPRQDILFRDNKELKEKVLQSLGITNNCRIFFYAPTFRNGMTENDLVIYKRQWSNILKALNKKTKEKWIGFIRLHPNISNLDPHHQLIEKNVYDVTDYPDMQELLAISDMVLTDYSSCVYDFGLTGRPGFVLIDDIESYKKERGLIPGFMDAIPFPIVTSDFDLIRTIETFNEEEYRKKLHIFYYQYCGLYPGGNAAKHVAHIIENLINNKNQN